MAEVAGLRPDAIVVETGIPGNSPDGLASIVTRGAGRANLAAAADALADAPAS
jgi:beta-N-acetylhexosaminidase